MSSLCYQSTKRDQSWFDHSLSLLPLSLSELSLSSSSSDVEELLEELEEDSSTVGSGMSSSSSSSELLSESVESEELLSSTAFVLCFRFRRTLCVDPSLIFSRF